MPLQLIASERFADHLTPPGHVERVERAHVFDAVTTAWRKQGGAIVEPRPATRDELLAVHSAEHIAAMESTASRRGRVCRRRARAHGTRAGIRARQAARPSCRARSANGVLSL